MRSVKISVSKLLETLIANRAQHVIDFKDALEAYRTDSIEALEKALSEAKDGKEIQHYISVTKPTSYEESYNTIIKMLEMSDDDVVELTMQEFTQYVEDKWQWKQTFLETANSYASAKRAF